MTSAQVVAHQDRDEGLHATPGCQRADRVRPHPGPEPRHAPHGRESLAYLAQDGANARLRGAEGVPRHGHPREDRGRDEERAGVDSQGGTVPEPGDEEPAERGAGQPQREWSVELVERVRLREHFAVDELRDDRSIRRPEHRLAGAVAGHEDQQLPQREHAGEREHGNGADEDPRDDVRAEQHAAARQPVREHSSEEEHRDVRQREGEPDHREGRRAVRQREGLPADRDEPDPVSEQRDRARRPEQPEVATCKGRKDAAQTGVAPAFVWETCSEPPG